MPRRVTSSVVLTLMLVLGVATIARATVIVPMDLGELSREAGAIVRGRVVAIDSRWTDDRRGVESLITLEVESALKGSGRTGETVTFRVPGGRLGRIRNIVVGAPQFTLDTHVVVFLGHRGPSIPHVVGFNQGVYQVAATSGGWTVKPPVLSGATFAGPVVRGDGSRQPLALEAFEQQVRALMQEVP